jgi:hypothetical protein
MADAVRVEHAVEARSICPQFGIGPLCDEVVDHPFLFAGGQIEDICREALFCLGQRPGHHLCRACGGFEAGVCATTQMLGGVDGVG